MQDDEFKDDSAEAERESDNEAPMILPSTTWKPSLGVLLLCGMLAGTILGAANGILSHCIADVGNSPATAGAYGGALGLFGGIIVVLIRRIIWGQDISVEVGTTVGLVYGIVPGLALISQMALVNRAWGARVIVALLMSGSMLGLILGAAIDRITEAIMARMKSVGDDLDENTKQ